MTIGETLALEPLFMFKIRYLVETTSMALDRTSSLINRWQGTEHQDIYLRDIFFVKRFFFIEKEQLSYYERGYTFLYTGGVTSPCLSSVRYVEVKVKFL